MFDQALYCFPSQIEPVETGIAMLKPRHQPQRMGVMVEAADTGGNGGKRLLDRMPERRVAEIMGQCHRLGEVLVASEYAREAARAICATSSE